MRLFLLALLFISPLAFSASAFFGVLGYDHDTQIKPEHEAACLVKFQSYSATNPRAVSYMGMSTLMAVPKSPWTGQLYPVCYVSLDPCEVSTVWNPISKSCATPCAVELVNNFTSAGQGLAVCIGNCAVMQVGDSVCHGVGSESDSFCTANYQKSGQFCPAASVQTQPCTSCNPAASSSAAASSAPGSGSTSSTGGTGGGGDTGGGDTGGTGGTGGSNSSSGGGNTGGGGDSSSAASSSGSGSGTDSGSVTGGGSCSSPPVCTGDALQCNLILQTYQLRCTGKALHSLTDAEPTLDLEQKLVDTKQRYTDEFNALKTQLSTTLALRVTGGGGGLASNIQNLRGAQVELGVAARTDFFSIIGALFMFAAAILSAFIILEK